MTIESIIKKELADIFEKKELEDVHYFPKHKAKVSALVDAYFQVLNNCDRQQLYYEKGFYVLVLSRSNNLSIQITVKLGNKAQHRPKLKKMLQVIKQHQPHGKVFLGQNNPRKSVSPDEEETSLAVYLKDFSKKIDIRLVDQFIMSSTEYFSFDENDYMGKGK